MSAVVFNDDNFLKKLSNVTPTQDSIQTLALWIIHHKINHETICKLWLKKLSDTSTNAKQRLALFYLANDVIQTCKRKNARIFQDTFRRSLTEAVAMVHNTDPLCKSVERIIDVWAERNVYDKEFTNKLREVLYQEPVVDLHLTKSPPSAADIETVSSPSDISTPAVGINKSDLEYQKIIAEFEPKKLCEKVAQFNTVQKETSVSRTTLEATRLLDINVEHIKQYRDKNQCSNFKNEFENSCLKLKNFLTKLSREASERKKLVKLMEQGEIFYDAQFKDATTVTTAYRSYGAKVHSVKRKLEEFLAIDSDAKLDNLDMEMSDDEQATTDIGNSTSTFSESMSKIGTSLAVAVEKHAKKFHRGTSQMNLDPRQNRSVLNKKGNQQSESSVEHRREFSSGGGGGVGGIVSTQEKGKSPSTPVRDEHSPSVNTPDTTGANPLDFLTKFINNKSSNSDVPSEPPNSTNLSYLVDSLKKFVGTGSTSQNQATPTPLMSNKFFDPASSFQSSFMEHSQSEVQQGRSVTPTKDELFSSTHFQQAPPAPPPLQFHPMFQMQQPPPLGLMSMMPPLQVDPAAHFHAQFGLYNQPPPQISPLSSGTYQQHISPIPPDKNYWMPGNNNTNEYNPILNDMKNELSDPGGPIDNLSHNNNNYEDVNFQKRNDGQSRRGRGSYNGGYNKNSAHFQQNYNNGKSFGNNRRIPTISSQRSDAGGYSERGRGRYNNNNNSNSRF